MLEQQNISSTLVIGPDKRPDFFASERGTDHFGLCHRQTCHKMSDGSLSLVLKVIFFRFEIFFQGLGLGPLMGSVAQIGC